MPHIEHSDGVDSWKLCCGPFCAECHTAMEKQSERVIKMQRSIEILAKEVASWRSDTEENYHTNAAKAATETDADDIASAAVREAGNA